MEVVERRLSRYFCKLNVLNANMCQIGEYVKNVYKKRITCGEYGLVVKS